MLSTSKSFFRKPGGGAAPATDASFAYVPLLTETGSTSSRSTTVADGALTPNTVTRNNLVSTGWTSPYQTDGYWSNQFNGTNAYLTSTIPALTGQFTIDFWVYRPASGNNWFFTIGDAISGSGSLEVYIGSSGAAFNLWVNNATRITSSTLPTVGAWNYVAVTRDASNEIKFYLNGTQLSPSPTYTSAVTFATTLRLGVEFYNSTLQYGNNYISNFRISNTVRTVSSNPTAPFTSDANTLFLSCQSNRFKDNSSNAATVTPSGTPSVQSGYYPFAAPTASPGAALFNGTNQYLSITNSTAIQLGAGNYTLEFWINSPPVVAGNIVIYDRVGTGQNSTQIFFDSTTLYCYGGSSSGTLIASATTPVANQWNHYALVRSASGTIIYRNGVASGSFFNDTTNYNGTQNTVIGKSGNFASSYVSGYISDFRITKGVAVYTANFTLPTAPLAATQSANSNGNPSAAITGTQTSLLLGLADSNYTSASSGGTNNTFIDDSTNAFTITRNGTPTQGSRTPYWPNGQWSNYFSGSTDYLTTPSSADFTLGASGNNFTVECWVYATGLQAANAIILSTFGNFGASALNRWAFAFGISASNSTLIWYNSAGNANVVTTSFPINSWVHIAAVRNGSTITVYVNGTSTITQTTNQDYTAQGALSVGFVSGAGYFNGYISNARVVKGTAIVPPAGGPTSPLTPVSGTSILTCQSNRFLDTNTQLTPKVITPSGTPSVQAFQPFSPAASYSAATYAGSGYFNGSTDYLSVASNAALGVSSSDFTIESWVYFTDVTGFQIVFDARTAQPSQSPLVTLQNTSRFQYLWNGVSFVNFGPTTLSPNTWYHVAVVRSAGVHTGYVNGVSYSLSTTDAAGVASAPIILGARTVGGANDYLKGYLSNFRFVKGVAIYTAAFTPPTTPVTNTAQTSLLLNMANAGIYDAAAQNNAITVADAQVSTTVTPKWPPSSMRFDGTGDYLSLVDAPVFDLGSSDFTIEAWVYTANSSNQIIYGRETASLTGILFQVSSGLTLGVNLSSNGSGYSLVLTGGTITANTWTYVAVTRVGSGTNNIKLFLGATPGGSATQVAQGTFASAIYTTTGMTPIVGVRNTTGIFPFNGYIQDFRLTRGVGRTITTPTAAFPTR